VFALDEKRGRVAPILGEKEGKSLGTSLERERVLHNEMLET